MPPIDPTPHSQRRRGRAALLLLGLGILGMAIGAAIAAAEPGFGRWPFDAAARIGRAHPGRPWLICVGAACGLVAAIVVWPLVLRLARRPRAKTLSDGVEHDLGLPLLAGLDRTPAAVTAPLVAAAGTADPASGAFGQLRRSVDFANLRHDARSILLTSANRQEGRSTTVANLAVAFARTGRRVALVDLDLEHPTLHTLFGVTQAPGVSDLVDGRTTLEDSVRTVPLGDDVPRLSTVADQPLTPAGNLYLITAGDPGTAAVDAPFTSERLDQLLRFLDGYFDLVLIDGPIAATASTAGALTDVVGGVLVLVNPGVPGDEHKSRLKSALEKIPAPKLGMILAGPGATS